MALNSTPTIDCAYESKKQKHKDKDKGAILCLYTLTLLVAPT